MKYVEHEPDEDDDDDEFSDHNSDESEEDWPEEQNETTIPCPHCRAPILEDSPRCPNCERYLSREDAPPPRRSWFFVICLILALWAVYKITF